LATLYSLLADLELKGLTKKVDVVMAANGGRPRRLYQLTRAGVAALRLGESIAQNLDEAIAQSA